MVRDEKCVTVQNQIDERVRANRCCDPTVVNDPPLFVRMICLDLEFPKNFPDSSSSLAANITMAMRFDAAVAATMIELRQRAGDCVCLLLNTVIATSNA